jgi:hypothetical protein
LRENREQKTVTDEVHDSDYFRELAAHARAASCSRGHDETALIAGELALAYTALARRRAAEGGAEAIASAVDAAEPA